MTDRRYRQQGYRDQRSEPPRPTPPRPAGDSPRAGGMLAKQTVSRCGACGAALPIATSTLEECPSCRAAIHACRNCSYFDTSRRFECMQPIVERVTDKNARNDCEGFSLRVAVEADASPDGTRPSDLRRNFDNLFKKP